MRKLVTTFGVLLLPIAATAQTTTVTNGNNGVSGAIPVYSGSSTLNAGSASAIFQSGNNVGIGTLDPYDTLHINGSFRIGSSGAAGNGFSFSQDANGSLQIQYKNPSSVYTNVMSMKYAGGIGIGTLSPAATLQVSSTASTPATMILGNGNTGNDGYTFLAFGLSAWSGGYASIQAAKAAGISWGDLVLNPNAGNVGIGTTAPAQKLEVAGSIQVDSGGIYFPGSTTPQTTPWTGVLCGGDYSEAMNVAGGKTKYEPGDVLVLSPGDNEDVQKSADPYSTMVAGIFATKPGVIGRREALAKSTNDIPMAMVGVVPTKVSTENGPIRKGDLLVTSTTPGFAMKGTDRSRMFGATIGKAMGSLNSGTGTIDVLVSLQ